VLQPSARASKRARDAGSSNDTARYRPGEGSAVADPYRYYQALRQAGCHRRDDLESWVIARYDDAQAVLHSDRWRLSARGRDRAAASTLTMMDPPEHTRVRRVASSGFTSRSIQGWEARIEETCRSVLATARRNGGLDIINDLGATVSMRTIALVLGLPPSDSRELARHAVALTPILDWKPTPDALASATRSALQLIPYFSDAVRERRRRPRDDFISDLVAAHRDGQLQSMREVVGTAILVFVAAGMTTAHLIGNAAYALLRFPDQLALLRSCPELLTDAIEETLRYESPVQIVIRTAAAEVAIGDVTIGDGDSALVVVGAANRDANWFDEPEQFRIDRRAQRHLSFGGGVHYCLGAVLGRVEARIAIGHLFLDDVVPRLVGAPEWAPSKTQRGLQSLRVEFS
jgi:pimeloyl-[acyl-carrier protein] synthase